MARKSDKLTPRQRQSRQIMRDKAAHKKRRVWVRRTQWAGGGLAVLTLVSGGVWVWQTKAIERASQAVADSVYGATVRAGFALEALYLEGRNRTSMADIEKALGVKKGDSIFRLSLAEMRERLEQVESVKVAAVERELPGTLYIRIVEREPVALWQHNGKIALVDDNGVVMNGIEAAPYQHLPLIVGDDAPKHVEELMTILASEPALAKRFAAAVRVGERRWNIRLDSGAEVRLPEKEPAMAWKRLSVLHGKQRLLDRDVKVIDLRLPDRMFITLPPEEMPGKVARAKET